MIIRLFFALFLSVAGTIKYRYLVELVSEIDFLVGVAGPLYFVGHVR